MEGQKQDMQRPGLEGHKGPVTIGEVLQVVGVRHPEKQIDIAVVSAIRSAEGRATGVKDGLPNGPATQAQHVLDRRTNPTLANAGPEPTLGTILAHAKDTQQLEKPVNLRDAQRITEAEMRNSPTGQIEPDGIGAAVQAAADYNVACGHVNPNAQ
ncbi:hypothetical protein SUGI_0177750 [Cryptomeria japonica]|nr:hypothetical protein SUGI_0177750 [Cryptomeria japonica]